MLTDTQKRYRSKCKQLRIDLYLSDADILSHLEQQESAAAYIKTLIRADMKKTEE